MGRALQGLIVTLFLTSTAYAQECEQRELERKPHFMPTGVFCKITDAGMVCFTLEEYKLLLEMDDALHTEKQKAVEKDSIIETQGLMLQQKDVVIKTHEEDKDTLSGQVGRLGTKWRTCLDEQEGFPWDSMFWGAGSGIVIGVAVGVVTFLALSMAEDSP